jgi:hypothetical protein
MIEAVRLLLLHDFTKLVTLLYRVDVSEKKLKALLAQHPDADAAVIITDSLIARQKEKLRTRQAFKPGDADSNEERW